MKVVCSTYKGLTMLEPEVRLGSGGSIPESIGLKAGRGKWGPGGEMGTGQ